MPNGDRAAWIAELSALVRALPDRQAVTIRLVYFHGVPVSEAAAWIGVSVKQTNALLAEALKQIGRAIGGSPITA